MSKRQCYYVVLVSVFSLNCIRDALGRPNPAINSESSPRTIQNFYGSGSSQVNIDFSGGCSEFKFDVLELFSKSLISCNLVLFQFSPSPNPLAIQCENDKPSHQ